MFTPVSCDNVPMVKKRAREAVIDRIVRLP